MFLQGINKALVSAEPKVKPQESVPATSFKTELESALNAEGNIEVKRALDATTPQASGNVIAKHEDSENTTDVCTEGLNNPQLPFLVQNLVLVNALNLTDDTFTEASEGFLNLMQRPLQTLPDIALQMQNLKNLTPANTPIALQEGIPELDSSKLLTPISSDEGVIELADFSPVSEQNKLIDLAELQLVQNHELLTEHEDLAQTDAKASVVIHTLNQSTGKQATIEHVFKEQTIAKIHELDSVIAKATNTGQNHIVVKIEPPELGNVSIRLTSENGTLKASFLVDSNTTKDILTNSLPAIKASLENAGIKTNDFNVDVRDPMDKQYYSQDRRHNPNDDNQRQETNKHKPQRPKTTHFEQFV